MQYVTTHRSKRSISHRNLFSEGLPAKIPKKGYQSLGDVDLHQNSLGFPLVQLSSRTPYKLKVLMYTSGVHKSALCLGNNLRQQGGQPQR